MMKEYKRDKRVLIPRDEFEEEAGEGLGGLSREEAEADLRELRARMERRLARPRAIWIPAAAAVTILLVGSALLVTLMRQRPATGPELAQKERTKGGAAMEDTTYIAIAAEVITDTALIAMAQPIEKKELAPSAPLIVRNAVTETVSEAADEVFAMVEEDAGVAQMAERPVVVVQMAQEEEAEKVEGVEEKAAAVQAEEVVVQALPQARATAMKARAGAETKTDAKAEGRAAARDVEALFSEQPAPVGGWEKYMVWVTRNMRYPEEIVPVVRQEVIVSFTVNADSTISGLKVVRSPGETFTSEAFRLLREGPKWVPAGSGTQAVAQEITLMFIFRQN